MQAKHTCPHTHIETHRPSLHAYMTTHLCLQVGQAGRVASDSILDTCLVLFCGRVWMCVVKGGKSKWALTGRQEDEI